MKTRRRISSGIVSLCLCQTGGDAVLRQNRKPRSPVRLHAFPPFKRSHASSTLAHIMQCMYIVLNTRSFAVHQLKTTVYSRRAAKTAVGRTTTSRKKSGGRGWGGDGLSDDDDDDGGGLSVDSLAHLRGGLGERRLGGRGWDGMERSRGGPRGGASSRLPPPRQGYGNPSEQEGSD